MSWSAIPTYINTGVRNLSLRPGLAGVPLLGMGSVPDPNTEAELEAAGWDPARIQILVQLNVTNEQLQSLPYPASEDEMTAAYNALALKLSDAATPSTSASRAGLPAGSMLTYSATWADSYLQLKSPPTVLANIQSILSGAGLVIDSQSQQYSNYTNFSGSQQLTLQVHTTSDRNAGADVKSIIDGAISTVIGSMPSSTIVVVANAAYQRAIPIPTPNAVNTPPPGNPTAWLQQNQGLVIAGLAALILLPVLIRKI